MKQILLSLAIVFSIQVVAQKPLKGLWQIDSLYGKHETTADTTLYKPIGLDVAGRRKRLTYWPGSGSTGVTGLAAIGSSPNANGASISGSTLTLQPADASNGGVIANAAQNIPGTKTFTSTSGVFAEGYTFQTGGNQYGALGVNVGSPNRGVLQLSYGTVAIGVLRPGTLTAGRTWTFPDKDGTVAMTSDLTGLATTTNSVQTLSSQFTDAGNTSTTETDLLSYTIGAGQLVNDGDRLEVEGWFIYAANSNTKTFKFKFGGYVLTVSSGFVTSSGGEVKFKGTIVRTGSGTQRIGMQFIPEFGTQQTIYATASETLSGSVAMKFTGQSGTASNDIVQKLMTVTYYPITP